MFATGQEMSVTVDVVNSCIKFISEQPESVFSILVMTLIIQPRCECHRTTCFVPLFA